jgi:hypothetical protein
LEVTVTVANSVATFTDSVHTPQAACRVTASRRISTLNHTPPATEPQAASAASALACVSSIDPFSRALQSLLSLMERSKQLIQYIETTGGHKASLALRRQAVAIRKNVTHQARLRRHQWSTLRAERVRQFKATCEARSVTHCREWASW